MIARLKFAGSEGKLDRRNRAIGNKQYLEELELRVKELEKENMKLRQEIHQYKKKELKVLGVEHAGMIDNIENFRKKIISTFIDPETGACKTNADVKLEEYYKLNAEKAMKKHQKLVDKSFEVILDNLVPFIHRPFIKDINSTIIEKFGENSDEKYQLIKKVQKMSKYQKAEFIKDNDFNEIDKHLIRLDPDKKQFKFFRDVLLPYECGLKQKLRKGVEYLVKSRNLILKTFYEVFAARGIIVKSKVFRDEQLVNANIKDLAVNPLKISSQELWGIQTKKIEIGEELFNHETLVPNIKKYIKLDQPFWTFEHEEWNLN